MNCDKAISLYKADSASSISSTMRGTRWSFALKIAKDDQTRDTYIFVPYESIKLKYRVLEIVQACPFGDIFRI